MERRARFRTGVFVAVILVIMALFTFRLYALQTSLTEEEIRTSNSLTIWTTVDAARGKILDRNGTVMVGNRASYNLIMIGYVFFNGPSPNESLLELLALCDELGIDVESDFPVSETRPYTYTLEDYSEAWQSYFRKFLTSRGWDPDMSAQNLMRNLREDYNIPDGLTEEEAYRLIAVRFELELRTIEGMPLDNYILARDVSSEDLAAVMELGVPGVLVETTTVREYNTTYAAHLLGHTGSMDAYEYENLYPDYAMDAVVGKEGVEYTFEKYLHGTDGLLETTILSTGEVLEQKYLSTPEPGNNVELTIDLGLQMTAENALAQVIQNLQENGVGSQKEGKDADSGAVVVLDATNNEVLAMASYPTYDPARYNLDFNELAEADGNPLLNHALQGLYPPGSIYKMVTAIAAMEFANVGAYYQVTDQGVFTKYELQGYAPACYIWRSSGRTHGTVNMMQALAVSCNYYFYEVGLQVATENVDYVAERLGLGEPTGIELYEETGTRANAETKAEIFAGTDMEAWVDGDKLQASIGQSLNSFTPLQMACYVSTLANQGARYKATLLSRVVSWDYQDLILESQPEIASQLDMDEKTIACINEGMKMTVSDYSGTANSYLSDYPISIAAKTGTAQHGSGGSDNASFVCYAPADDPQIAIAVYVEHGAQGGNLANVVRPILDAFFSQESKYETTYNENTVQ